MVAKKSFCIHLKIRKEKKNKFGQVPVLLYVYSKKSSAFINTGIKIKSHQFDIHEQKIIKHQNANELNFLLNEKKAEIIKYIILNEIDTLPAKEIIKQFETKDININLFDFIQQIISDKRINNKRSTASSYECMLNQLKKSNLITNFNDLTKKNIQLFDNYLHQKGINETSRSIYLRSLRAVCNKAVNEDLLIIYPFKGFKLPTKNNVKRNISIQDIKNIYTYQPENQKQDIAKNIFLLSFFFAGMNFKDILNIKKTDVYQNRIDKNRAKTGTEISILIHPVAKTIIEKYAGNLFLLEFIEGKNFENRKSEPHSDFIKVVNKQLKIICSKLEINKPVSTYYARHSFATIAANLGVKHEIISILLGHKLNSITDYYIEYNKDVIDDSLFLVIDKICG